jgi:hypothetical protein
MSSETGSQQGAFTVVVPRPAAEAEALAVALTRDLLPSTIQRWLADMEQHKPTVPSILGLHPTRAPTLTPEECQQLSLRVRSPSEIRYSRRQNDPNTVPKTRTAPRAMMQVTITVITISK